MSNQVLLLLADDEPLIRLTCEEVLQEGGYAVLTASTGRDAMAALDEHGTELAGLITDIRIGAGPDGWELARHARELNALMSVVYITGDSAADWSAQGVPNSIVLQKPFADAQLLTAISTLLNQAAAIVPPPTTPS